MICTLIIKYAAKHGLQALLLASIVHQESTLKPDAVNKHSHPYSYGLGQLIESTAKEKFGLYKKDILDIEKNLDCTARYLASQLDRYQGDEDKAISAYNAGSYSTKNKKYVDLVHQKAAKNICGI